MTLASGTSLGPYEILSPIGAGGMGEVYRAKDTRLDREVAIKVLPDAFARDPERVARFQREAKAVAAISHPNIMAIHDVGTEDGVSFVVTELLEGETLRDCIRGSPIPWRDAVEMGMAITDGLAAAHNKGIIHRDLKPENIFLTSDGLIKILDFGLAHIEPVSTDQSADETPTLTLHTRPGTVMGTIHYMSPEQVRGLKTDARSDIFSLGCVLYEMVTGKRAFAGNTDADTITAILREQPASMSSTVKDVTPGLDRVISRCLEKKPAQRNQSARDVGFALRDVLTDSRTSSTNIFTGIAGRKRVIPTILVIMLAIFGSFYLWKTLSQESLEKRESSLIFAPIDSIAVLPLENLSGDPDQDYFVDGITEALIMNLAKIKALKVISRTSAMHYKGTDKTLPQIAKELNVKGIVEGSVILVGDQVRVTAQLIHAASDTHLWADSYTRDLRDILSLQNEIALAITQEIEIAITPEEKSRLTNARQVDPEVYKLYLQGHDYSNKWTDVGFEKATEFFRKAIDLDPTYAPAWAGLADNYYMMGLYNIEPHNEIYPLAIAAAKNALKHDNTLGLAHATFGLVKFHVDWDWTSPEKDFQRALELSPGNAHVHYLYSTYLSLSARFDESINEIKRAVELDPFQYSYNAQLGFCYLMANRYDESLTQYLKLREKDPNDGMARALIPLNFAFKGMYDEALAECEKMGGCRGELAWIYAVSGKREEALKEIERLKTKIPGSSYVIAEIYAGLGEKDQAIEYLNKAFDENFRMLLWLNTEPTLNPLRDDPRFDELLRRIGLEVEEKPHSTAHKPDDKIKLAVLPFENVSRDPDTDYLSNEIPASIIDKLSALSSLDVISRSGAFRFDSTREDATMFGKNLGASIVLTGQLNARGKNLSIRAELVDVITNQQLWSKRYSRELTDIMAVEADITQSIFEALRLQLTQEERTELAKDYTKNAEAYRSLLQGRFWFQKFTLTGWKRALTHLQDAVRMDPTYALAHAELSKVYSGLGIWFGDMPPDEAGAKAKQAAATAITLDDTLGQAHGALAFNRLFYDWDWAGAEEEFLRSISLAPESGEVYLHYSILLRVTGRLREAEEMLKIAQQLDPTFPMNFAGMGATYTHMGRYEEGIEQCKKALDLDSQFPPAYQMLGNIFLAKGMYDEAISHFEKGSSLRNRQADDLGYLGTAYALAGNRAKALAVLKELSSISSIGRGQVAAAKVHACLGNVDAAFASLEQAYRQRDTGLLWLNLELQFESLRGDPRYVNLVRRMKLAPDQKPQSKIKTPDDKIKLAVLPFDDMSPNPQDWFSDGMTGELIATLGKIKSLGVISRTSVMQYKNTTKPLPQIARELNINRVIEGTVTRVGDRIRITVQLIDALTEKQLWSNRYERDMSDVITLQNEVVQAIAGEVRATLTPEEQNRLTRARAVNPEAYRDYIKGRYHWNQRTESSCNKAIEYFESAIERDSNFALAHVGLAEAFIVVAGHNYVSPKEALPRAKTQAEIAIALDDTLGRPHIVLGVYHASFAWDLHLAENEFRKGTQLDPGYATGHQWFAEFLVSQGKVEEALQEIQRAQELSPVSMIIGSTAGIIYYRAHRYDDAIAKCLEVLDFDTTFSFAHYVLGRCYTQKGMFKQAISEIKDAITFSSRSSELISTLGYIYAVAGQTDQAITILEELNQRAKTQYVSSFDIAIVHSGLGDADQAFHWLNRAFDERAMKLAWIVKVDPLFKSLHSDPRYDDLLRRIGLEPSHAAGGMKPRQIRSPRGDAIGKTLPPDDKIMLAVLPFKNLGLAEDEYFADGISDEIRSRLASVRKLGVISRSSAFQYKNTDKSIRQIGAELGVDYLIDGTIRWDKRGGGAGRVRITPELIRISDDLSLWSQPYNRVLEDIFEVQSNIAAEVIKQLKITLLEPERQAIEVIPTENLDAYNAYLRGEDYMKQTGPFEEKCQSAIRMYKRAIKLDPKFALAYAKLSGVHSNMYHHGIDRTTARATKAKQAVDRALELQPQLSEAYYMMGMYHYWCNRNYDLALEALATAEKNLSNDSAILSAVGFIWRRQGRLEEALDNFKRRFELNPLRASAARAIAETYLLLRKYSDAVQWYDRTISLAPNQVGSYQYKALIHWLWHGDIKMSREALEEMPGENTPVSCFLWFRQELYERNYEATLVRIASRPDESLDLDGRFISKSQLAGLVYGLMSESERSHDAYDTARVLLEEEIKKRPDDHRIHSSLGIVYAGLRRKEDAIREGKLGVELFPVSKDALIGPHRVEDLAYIYTLVGEYDAALDKIEYLLSIPSGTMSVPMLKLDPRWDSLRDHPRYKDLINRFNLEP